VQTEQYFMGAMGRLLNEDLLARLRGDTLDVIQFMSVTKANSAHPPRLAKRVDGLTPVGKECLRRALLELERRVCGNKTEVVSHPHLPVVPSEREMMASVLDPRTNRLKVLFEDREYRKKCVRLMKAEYVKYGLGAKQYHAEVAAKAAAVAAAAAAKAVALAAAAAATAVAAPVTSAAGGGGDGSGSGAAALVPLPGEAASPFSNICWGDSDTDVPLSSESEDEALTPEEEVEQDITRLEVEFDRVLANYRKACSRVIWHEEFKGLGIPEVEANVNPVAHLR
jgi:hypothetical protein